MSWPPCWASMLGLRARPLFWASALSRTPEPFIGLQVRPLSWGDEQAVTTESWDGRTKFPCACRLSPDSQTRPKPSLSVLAWTVQRRRRLVEMGSSSPGTTETRPTPPCANSRAHGRQDAPNASCWRHHGHSDDYWRIEVTEGTELRPSQVETRTLALDFIELLSRRLEVLFWGLSLQGKKHLLVRHNPP